MKKSTCLVLTFIFVVLSVNLFADCDMMGMVSMRGRYLSWENSQSGSLNDPGDMFTWLKERSTDEGDKPNPDGYGLIYYPEDGSFYYNDQNSSDPLNQAWYLTGSDTYYNHTNPFDPNNYPYNSAVTKINDNSTKASLVLGHARNGTGGFGSHPFRFEWEGTTYTFVHNGYTKTSGYSDLHNAMEAYLTTNGWEGESNWGEPLYDDWIDSEVLFHYIMAHIVAVDGDVFRGIYEAMTETDFNISTKIQNPTTFHNCVNYALSDGTSIYLFRNKADDNHRLQIKNSVQNMYIFKTGGTDNASPYEELPLFHLKVLSPEGIYPSTNLSIYHNLYNDRFISGDITTDTTLPYGGIITDDVNILPGVTLNVQGRLEFYGSHNVLVQGTLNLAENKRLDLSCASKIEIINNGVFNIGAGSTISGKKSLVYAMPNPDLTTGNKQSYPGDIIIARDGGLITTGTISEMGNRVIIKSNSNELWDGIKIVTPRHRQTFNFVNCDISGIKKLSISSETLAGMRESIGILNLYCTDFHNCGQISVTDKQTLIIKGTENNYCNLYENLEDVIYAAEANVTLDYAWIGAKPNYGYGSNSNSAISIFDGYKESSINNCVVHNNDGYGVKLNGGSFNFTNNQISSNSSYGMLCYDQTIFLEFNDNMLLNNGAGRAEYAGWQSTYLMGDINANIFIIDSQHGSGAGEYLATIIGWDGVNPVDVRGTNLVSSNLPNLYPSNSAAWIFNRGVSPAKELLLSASSDIENDNIPDAIATFKQLTAEYSTSTEAALAVYSLYHINNQNNQDYSNLRSYLESLTPAINTPLYKAKKDIIAKCYMKDGDYLSAINLLEEIIQTSQINDNAIAAMIEQGYNYLKLSQVDEKSLPTSCTITATNLNDYQARVKELESQYSFMQEIETNSVTQLSNELISSNYPNPFNPTTTISYDLPSDENVVISIFNLKGQKVKQLQNEVITAGHHKIVWDGRNDSGNKISSGIYFYKIKAGNYTSTKKMVLMK